ncbi:predicted isopentenyl-diphosphate delta-isomerase [Aromatoleum aromaticum EbN1]|uniref:Predicted isopentenyl-diphosphate delta-isomerase n=1 Tax=Aromatoleum aromaticum (strain DSM 19018 / LMG 30748 / EbN1) TaxID=76114 RepID=Q5P800_AROAE|nr:predicted isopentenyl-diphosphate delta-isomerase [Aromatoleum aromaticum EbN1]
MLLLRRAGTGFFDGLYSLPGGHVEPGESLLEAAVREMSEETGLCLHADALEYVGVVHRRSDTNRVDFFVRAKRFTGEPQIREPDKCDGLGWFGRDGLPAATVPYIRAALDARPAPWVLELGWQDDA